MNDKTINDKLESLVHCRFSAYELNALLSLMFDTTVEVSKYIREDEVKEELPNLDDQLLVVIENESIKLKIDVDLYYLTDNGGNFYITETCFNHA